VYKRQLPHFIHTQHSRPDVAALLSHLAEEIQSSANDLDLLIETLQHWIDQDRKHPTLKTIQGMIWLDGYQNASYRAPIYPDAEYCLRLWHQQHIPLYVYSSGSVPAQKLFFQYSEYGDLRHLFSGNFDTHIGAKREAKSYHAIAAQIDTPPASMMFLSDIVEELDAARDAGWQTVLIDRLNDYPTPRHSQMCNGHQRVNAFTEITLPHT
jgi:enolase-phosphatase E1